MKLYVALPAMGEKEWLPRSLEALAAQEHREFEVWVHVNQPEGWWGDAARRPICENNRETLAWLSRRSDLPLRILDRSSPGRGWEDGKGGAGWARREMMDAMSREGEEGDIVVSLDADTLFDRDYLAALAHAFRRFPGAPAISVPYFHPLPGDAELGRAILRYECYLRHYAINLWRIGSPYSFTALGSALAFPIRTYRRVGGMPTKNGGEDFYFLQKAVKTGRILHWCSARVRPSARYSGRVAFGTGLALARASWSGWSSYPIISPELFDEVGDTAARFPELHGKTLSTPVTEFLCRRLRTDDPWEPLRRNHHDPGRFVRACHERLDGLRIFQYLRWRQRELPGTDEERLGRCLKTYYPGRLEGAKIPAGWSFRDSPLEVLDRIRRILEEIENDYRRRDLESMK